MDILEIIGFCLFIIFYGAFHEYAHQTFPRYIWSARLIKPSFYLLIVAVHLPIFGAVNKYGFSMELVIPLWIKSLPFIISWFIGLYLSRIIVRKMKKKSA